MAKVTAVKTSSPGKNFGVFKAEKFDLFTDEGLAGYAALRNRAADLAEGIKIETMREFSRKTVETEGDGETRIQKTTEEIILVVQYWENPVRRKKGDSDEEIHDAQDAATGPGVLVPARSESGLRR